MEEIFSRIRLLVGESGYARLAASHICLAGYGAVGSFVAEALVRSGIGHLRIIDADCYEASNINRQLGASLSSIGRVKTEVGRERLLQLNPELDLECEQKFVSGDSPELMRPFKDGIAPEVYIDAIDSIDAKVSILAEMYRRGVKVFSSMGAARRRDMSQIRFGDISETTVCPLARDVRKRLRQAGIERGIGCVYSVEAAKSGSHVSADRESVRAVVRPSLGSMVTVTGCFGLRLASECMNYLLEDVLEEG